MNRIVPVAFLSGSGAKCSDIERRLKSILAGRTRPKPASGFGGSSQLEVLLAGVRNRITLPGR